MKKNIPSIIKRRISHRLLWMAGSVMAVAMACTLAWFGMYKKPSPHPSFRWHSIKEGQMWMAETVKKVGAKKAYKIFISEMGSFDPDIVHYVGHFLGDKLYADYGLSAVTICASALEYGCAHGVMLKALQEKGDSVLPLVHQACLNGGNQNSIAICLHAVGHASLAIKGYTYDDLTGALSSCDTFLTVQYRSSCYSGIFMEYNFPMEQQGANTATWFRIRPFNPLQPLDPCDRVPEATRAQCYMEMGSRWSAVADMTYQKMGTYCQTIADFMHRTWCFYGVGRNLSEIHKYKTGDIKNLCSTMPSPEGQYACIRRAMATLIHGGQSDALELCSLFTNEQHVQCSNDGLRIQDAFQHNRIIQ